MITLHTKAAQLGIERLGDPKALARSLGVTSRQLFSWMGGERMPDGKFLALADLLADLSERAPDEMAQLPSNPAPA